MTCNEMAFFPSNFMLQTHDQDHPSTSLNQIIPSCTPQDFHGVASLLGKRSLSFSRIEGYGEMNGEDDLSDDCSQAGEKKKRLNMEQVKTLEKNFELGNKLEPERKMQLARALGLQPRQIAIWFQNRRARWKTKQLEKDYELLKKQFEAIKADNDALQAQNKKLQAEIWVVKDIPESVKRIRKMTGYPTEILALKGRETAEPINLNKETEGSCSNRSENSSEINLDISRTPAIDSPLSTHPNRPLFPSLRPTAANHLLQNSTRSELQCPKIEQPVQEESFCNMFMGMDDQSSLWPWSEHHNFH